MLDIFKVQATTLPDLWFQAVYNIFEHGRRFTIDKGSYAGQIRLEYDYFIGHVLNPAYGSETPEILPQIPAHMGIPNPVEFEYVYGGGGYERSYVEHIMTDSKKWGESYTYGSRLNAGLSLDENDLWYDPGMDERINQIQKAIETYKKYGFRNNQMVLQIAQISDIELDDPPCLRHIDTRIQDGKLYFFIYFRSWDLWGGMPANLAGIEFLHKFMAEQIGVDQGEFIVESKGLHLYGYAEDLAKIRCMKEE